MTAIDNIAALLPQLLLVTVLCYSYRGFKADATLPTMLLHPRGGPGKRGNNDSWL